MLDLETTTHIFNNLYSDINGYTLSAQARNRVGYHDKAHTYGEVMPESFYKIIQRTEPREGEVFYDLGSGTGKAVILAALLFNFSECVGIEILKELHETAESILHRLHFEVEPHLHKKTLPKTVFKHKDFLRCDFSQADIVFIHATCFYEELWEHLARKLEQLQSGSRVVTVTKMLHSPMFEHLRTDEHAMSWGKATIHFYKKI